MESIDTSTIGGRIRLVRQKMGVSLAGLGSKIGVSANYVSVIERNAKRPSDDLLARIADATGTSFNWLKTGIDDEHQRTDDNPDIDPSLFLNILMIANPSITKATIATTLAVDDLELDKILAGGVKCDPAWEGGLSALSQRIDDFPSLLKKLDRILDYLHKEETKKNNYRLIRMFRDYLEQKYDSDFSFNSNTPVSSFRVSSPLRIVASYFPKLFTCKQQKPESSWNIWSFSGPWRSDLKIILDLIKLNSNSQCENIILSVDEESAFEALRSANWIESSPWDGPNRPKLFLMHIDTDSMRVVDDMVQVEI